MCILVVSLCDYIAIFYSQFSPAISGARYAWRVRIGECVDMDQFNLLPVSAMIY